MNHDIYNSELPKYQDFSSMDDEEFYTLFDNRMERILYLLKAYVEDFDESSRRQQILDDLSISLKIVNLSQMGVSYINRAGNTVLYHRAEKEAQYYEQLVTLSRSIQVKNVHYLTSDKSSIIAFTQFQGESWGKIMDSMIDYNVAHFSSREESAILYRNQVMAEAKVLDPSKYNNQIDDYRPYVKAYNLVRQNLLDAIDKGIEKFYVSFLMDAIDFLREIIIKAYQYFQKPVLPLQFEKQQYILEHGEEIKARFRRFVFDNGGEPLTKQQLAKIGNEYFEKFAGGIFDTCKEYDDNPQLLVQKIRELKYTQADLERVYDILAMMDECTERAKTALDTDNPLGISDNKKEDAGQVAEKPKKTLQDCIKLEYKPQADTIISNLLALLEEIRSSGAKDNVRQQMAIVLVWLDEFCSSRQPMKDYELAELLNIKKSSYNNYKSMNLPESKIKEIKRKLLS